MDRMTKALIRWITPVLILSSCMTCLKAQPRFDGEWTIENTALHVVTTNYGMLESRHGFPPLTTHNEPTYSLLSYASVWVGGVTSSGDTVVVAGEGNAQTRCPEWHPLAAQAAAHFDTLQPGLHTVQTQYTDEAPILGHTALGLTVTHTVVLPQATPFAILEFTVRGSQLTDTLSGVYIGVLADVDLADRGMTDRILIAPNTTTPVFSNTTAPGAPMVGLYVLSPHSSQYSFWTRVTDPATDSQRYHYLQTATPEWPTLPPADYRLLQSVGPEALAPQDSITVAFGLLLGHNLQAFSGLQNALTALYGTVAPSKGNPTPPQQVLHGQEPPSAFQLHPNFPNPFNPATRISYAVPATGAVTLAVYSLRGTLIKTLVQSRHVPGYYHTQWQGKDAQGRPVASGVYLLHAQFGASQWSRKMIVLR